MNSVIVINYNNARYLNQSLTALFANHPDEVIVVDDASTDNSVEIIKSFPVTHLMQNKENKGPVAARNIGARVARGDYILFLDSDAAAEPGYVSTLSNFLDTHKNTAMVSGRVWDNGKRMRYNFSHDPTHMRDALENFWYFCMTKFQGTPVLSSLFKTLTLNFPKDKIRRVDWVVEMACMARRSAFNELGGFDEHFFMFFEGPDFCRRARQKGWKIWYTPEASVKHLGGHSHPGKRGMFFRQSRKYYYKKFSGKL